MAKLSKEQLREILAPVVTALSGELADKVVPSVWQLPEGFKFEKFYIEGSAVEHFVPDNKRDDLVIFHLHGGAYEFHLMDMYRDASINYSKAAGNAEVYSLDYLCAPTVVFPNALEESVKVYKWLLSKGYDSKNIIIVGDSAGGNLTLATTLYLRDNNLPLPKKLLTLSPWVYLGNDFDSVERNKENDLILGTFNPYAFSIVAQRPKYAGDTDLKNPLLSPLFGDYTNFPPLMVQCGDAGILFDEIDAFAKHVKEYNVDFKYHVFKDMFHDFQLILPILDEAEEAWKEITEYLSK